MTCIVLQSDVVANVYHVVSWVSAGHTSGNAAVVATNGRLRPAMFLKARGVGHAPRDVVGRGIVRPDGRRNSDVEKRALSRHWRVRVPGLPLASDVEVPNSPFSFLVARQKRVKRLHTVEDDVAECNSVKPAGTTQASEG
jgi:hypothetical protein